MIGERDGALWIHLDDDIGASYWRNSQGVALETLSIHSIADGIKFAKPIPYTVEDNVPSYLDAYFPAWRDKVSSRVQAMFDTVNESSLTIAFQDFRIAIKPRVIQHIDPPGTVY